MTNNSYKVNTELIDKLFDKQTQSKIAEETGVPQSTLSELYRDRSKYGRMSVRNAHKLTAYAERLFSKGDE